MDSAPNKQQIEIIAKAKKLARECLEPRAAEVDQEADHPRKSWHDVWKHGLLAMTVPEEYGGLGLDTLTYVMAVEQMAGGCINTAMTVHMHSVVMRYIDALANPDQKAFFYPEVVTMGKLFGSWGSEPNRRGGSGSVQTVMSRRDDEYVINGIKHFCTMAGGAYRYMVHCNMEHIDGSRNVTMALIPHDNPGLTIKGDWDTLGMRGTVSPGVSFEECRVKKEWILGDPGQAESSGIGQVFGLGYAAIYIGAASRAVEWLKEYVKTHRFEPDPEPMARNILLQKSFAEMTIALEGARNILYKSAWLWPKSSDSIYRAILAARAKYLASEAAIMVTTKAVQVLGGRVAQKRYPLERIYRDVRTCTLMPPSPDRCLEIVGKTELGLDDNLLMLRHAS